MDDKVRSLLNSIVFNESVCLNFAEKPKKCREIFRQLVAVRCWYEKYAIHLKSLELPTENFTAKEFDILTFISKLPNLKSCILTGKRQGKDGARICGGLFSFPPNFALPVSITNLELQFNSFQVIPDCLTCLTNLQIITLDYNDIELIPPSFSTLMNLEEVYLRNNKLNNIDDEIYKISKLRIFKASSNKLVQLPNTFHLLPSLECLDVSNNAIERLPHLLFSSKSLKRFYAGNNYIDDLPQDFFSCICHDVELVDLQYNNISQISDELKQDERFLLHGNTPTILNKSLDQSDNDYDVPVYVLKSNYGEINVHECGGCYQLPSGIKIVVPNGFVHDGTTQTVFCNLVGNEQTIFTLPPSDQLLSAMLEMQPRGLVFSKAMRISLPYCYYGFDKQKREIVMRVISIKENGISTYEDIRSEVQKNSESDNSYAGVVTAFVNHFSMFAVISRLVEDTDVIQQDSSKSIFSSVDPFTRLHFPQGSVESNTKVTMQILAISPLDVEDIVQSRPCAASNVLHVSVTPTDTVFNHPVTVRLALPNSLVGKSYNSQELCLLKCATNSEEWMDITDDVNPVFSTIDVSFQVRSFSMFSVVMRNVGGFMRKIICRTISHKVRFLAVQKTALPSIVLAQCVRSDRLKERMKQLVDTGYSVEDSYTVVQELLEGDQFRVKVGGGIQLKSYSEADKEHLETRVLVKRFYSQFDPEESGFCKFCIEPSMRKASTTVYGRVSFYKISQPPCEATDQKEHTLAKDIGRLQCTGTKRRLESEETSTTSDSLESKTEPSSAVEDVYLDEVLLTLKNADSDPPVLKETEYQLRFGELGTGMFSESNLRYFASRIGANWPVIGTFLGIPTITMEHIQSNHPQMEEQIFQMLYKWSNLHKCEENCVKDFINALRDAERNDLADDIEKIYEDGRENFRDIIKRRKAMTTPDDF